MSSLYSKYTQKYKSPPTRDFEILLQIHPIIIWATSITNTEDTAIRGKKILQPLQEENILIRKLYFSIYFHTLKSYLGNLKREWNISFSKSRAPKLLPLDLIFLSIVVWSSAKTHSLWPSNIWIISMSSSLAAKPVLGVVLPMIFWGIAVKRNW